MKAPGIIPQNYKGHNLVFIVGCPRSGTTWIQRLLAAHQQIATGQESDIFDIYIGPQLRAWKRDIKPEHSGRGIIGLGCYFTEEEFMLNLHNYMMVLLDPLIGKLRNDQLFIEKTPSHALFISEIHTLLPEAKFIHIVRDPRDVISSLLAASKSWGWFWAPKDPVSAASFWVQHIKAVNKAKSLLPANQFIEIRYESVMQNTRENFLNLLSFLGLHSYWSENEILSVINANDAGSLRSGKGSEIPLGGESLKAFGKSLLVEPPGFVRKAVIGGWKQEFSVSAKLRLWNYFRNKNSYGYQLNKLTDWFK